MSRYTAITDYQHGSAERIGVLACNLGTPEAPEAGPVRRYLKEFLSDPRVVEVPRPIWWLILNGIILNVRPKRSAKAYAKVWTDAGSPLLVHSRAQSEALQTVLSSRQMVPEGCRRPTRAAVGPKLSFGWLVDRLFARQF